MLMNGIWGDLMHKFIGIQRMPSAAEAFSAKSFSCGFSSFSAFLFFFFTVFAMESSENWVPTGFAAAGCDPGCKEVQLNLKKNSGRGQAVRGECGCCKKIDVGYRHSGSLPSHVTANLGGDSSVKKKSTFLISASGCCGLARALELLVQVGARRS